MQITLQGKTLDQEAIELIREYEPRGEHYYLGFSGGKDSVVIEHLAKRAKVHYRAVYNVSPIDPPDIWRFIKLNYPRVRWDNHAQGFWGDTFLANGLPTRRQRWCCRIIKEAGGKGQVRILGTRAAESAKRATYPIFNEERQSLYPILYWSNSDVWQYIAEYNLKVPTLYQQGFDRIGCVLCPFKHKRENELDIQMFPKTVALWKLAAQRYVDKRLAKDASYRFKTGEEYFNWWIDR